MNGQPSWLIPMWMAYLTCGILGLAFCRKVPWLTAFGVVTTIAGSFAVSHSIIVTIRDGIR